MAEQKQKKTDPLLEALLNRLPEPGSEWPAAERRLWLLAAVGVFDLVYGDTGVDITVGMEGEDG